MLEELRFPSVSGKFYPIDAGELASMIQNLLDSRPYPTSSGKLKGLILPHSGYEYCGEILAAGYSEMKGMIVDEVFVLGFSNFHEVDKTAFSDFKYWQTPLGKTEQSHRVTQIVMSDDPTSQDILKFDNEKHHGEHTVEIQLPFLQEIVSGEFRIIPMLAGKVSPRLLSKTFDKHIDPDDMLIVSAELSHGYPLDYAKDIDKLMIENILKMDSDFIEAEKSELTNKVGVSTIIHLARLRGWKPKLLGYFTSAEKYPDNEKVSGYAAIGFYS